MKGRGATWNPQNRFETLEYVRDEEAPPEDELAADDLSARSDADDHRHERQPGRRLRGQHQSVSRLRARLHLLLRAPHARVPRLLRRPRFRDQDPGQGRRAGAAARGAEREEVAAEGAGDERRHRSLSAGGTAPRDHPRLPGGAGGVPQSGRRSSRRTTLSRATSISSPSWRASARSRVDDLHHHARPGAGTDHGAAHVDAGTAAGGDRARSPRRAFRWA